MSQTSANPNPIQKSLMPMLHTWTRCISWTVLLSILLAVLFALMLDGCAAVQNKAGRSFSAVSGPANNADCSLSSLPSCSSRYA